MKFKSIYSFIPSPAIISSDSDVVRDDSLTISQIISLHLRGLSANVHIYDDVQHERGFSDYSDEQINDDYYEMETDFSDFNDFVASSGDNPINQVLESSKNGPAKTSTGSNFFKPGIDNSQVDIAHSEVETATTQK